MNQFNYDGVKLIDRANLENIGFQNLDSILESNDSLMPPGQSRSDLQLYSNIMVDDYSGILKQLRDQIQV